MSSNSGPNEKDPAGGEGFNKEADQEDSERSAQAAMCLTSDEVNYLVYRYDQLPALLA